jgi:hypothetical protein
LSAAARRALCAGLAAALLCGPAPASTEPTWSHAGSLGLGYDSNAGNAVEGSDDARETASLQAGLATEYHHPVGLYAAWQLRAGLDGDARTEIESLSEARGAARLRLLARPGAGFHVPVLALWGSAGARVSGSRMRGGADYRAGAYVMEQLTTTVRARLEYGWLQRESAGRVFDLDATTLGVTLDWQALPALALYASYEHYRGGTVVSALEDGGSITPKSQHLYLEPLAEAIEPDDAFGDDWFAFRMQSTTGSAALGANVPLANDLSLDAQARYARAEVDGSAWPYQRWLGAVTLLKRF